MRPADFRQNEVTITLMKPETFRTEKFMQRSGTGRFIVSVVGLADPVQSFIAEYSSYDYGVNPYLQPTVHIRPRLSRGYVGVSVRLRF